MPESRKPNSEKRTGNPEIAARLKTAIAAAGGPSKVSEKTGISLRTLHNYLSARSGLKSKALIAISELSGYPAQWIETGSRLTTPEQQRKQVAQLAHDVGIDENIVKVPFYKDLKPAAGGGSVIEGEVSELVAFDRTWLRRFFDVDPRTLIMFAAQGHSMEPMIHGGDPLLVDTSATGKVLVDGVYVFRHENAFLVKQLQVLPGHRIRVTSINTSFDPYDLRLDDEALDFIIFGRVICICRRL
jgi:phage repressor protein C with HTH and peptisase S24 domain